MTKDIRPELARNQMMGDALLSMQAEERDRIIAEIQAEAEAKSKFKLWQLVRCCQSLGFSLVTWKSDKHDHKDPKQHFNSRIMGWDCFGRIKAAQTIWDNPHCYDWPWSDNMIRPRNDDEDWFPHSKLKVGMEIVFMWELYSFRDPPGRKEYWPMGAEVPGTLVGPHINTSDWLVQYPRYDSGSLIHRVVNQRQMRLPSGEAVSSLR